MTISVYQGDMSADDKPESSHEFNCFLDRQLQNKLLDVDEQLTSTENYLAQNHGVHYVSIGEGKSTFVKSQTKCEEITGWVQNTRTNFRKPDKENKPTKEFIQPWKDYKTKAQLDTYVFKHFKDPRYYIEQYRQEHALVLGQRSPLTRSELGSGGDLRRYVGHHSSPSPNSNGASNISTQNYVPPQPIGNCNSSNNGHNHSKSSNNNSTSSSSHNGTQLLTASMHYTNKKDTASLPNNHFTSSQNKFNNQNKNNSLSLHNSHNNQNSNHGHQCTKHVHSQSDQGYKYKLAPEATWSRSESSQSTDHGEPRTPRIHSGKGDGRGGKMPTKVMVPAGVPNTAVKQHPLQTVTVQSKSPANVGMGDTSSHVTSHAVPTGSIRTLDTLACVAADKQIDPEFQSSAAGLTWCERLEMLRAVNKRPEKAKQKPPKLRYYKDSPVSSHEPPGPLFSSRARLYEQRRIKHVLEQTKLKGADHYEWLSDGKVRRYRYQHSESSDDDTTSDSSEYDDDEESLSSLSITTKSLSHTSTPNGDGNSSEKPQLQRYQVPLAVKGGGWKIIRSANAVHKSHSTL